MPTALAAESRKSSGVKREGTTRAADTRPVTSGEKFEKNLEGIRELVKVAEEKSNKGQEPTAELDAIKAKKAQIETIDVELKNEFAVTEKRLKDAKLPQVILDRHTAFVKNYEKNLTQLKSEIDDIDQANTATDRRAKLKISWMHLGKIIPRKIHKPFNPARLPSRTRELKSVRTSWLDRSMDWLVPSAEAAENPPTSADLAETLETPQTQEIRDLAQQLGGTSVSLYEYVRNAFTYEPYAGSTKGALQTLREKSGNEWDQASLLSSLYRASGIPCRYVVGTVEIPIDAAMSWLGVEDPRMAATLLSTLGRTTNLVISGGKITAIRTQQVWVRAYVPFLYSRGATTDPGDMWVDVDPSFKGQTVTKALTVAGAPVFDQTSYLSTFRTESPFDFYRAQLQSFLDANNPGYVPEALAWESEITPERFGVLIGQPPYIIKSVIGTYSEIPDSYRQKFTLSITDPASGDSLLYYTAPMPQIIGKRMTLSYVPATTSDADVIANYGGLYSTPPYLVMLKPEIKIEGASVTQGNAIGSGQEQSMEFIFDTTIDQGRVENVIIAGGYFAIGLSARSGDTRANILERTNQLAQLAGTIEFNDPTTLDQKLSEILYLSATVYHQNLDAITKKIAALDHVVDVRDVSDMLCFLSLKVDTAFGAPTKVTPAGITGDMDRNLHTVVPVDGDMNRIKLFMQLQGNESSFLEHDVTEKIYQTQALSSVKGIQLAHDQGIPVHTINSRNINSELPMLQISSEAIANIVNAVNAGQEIIVPERSLTLGNWSGIGYIVQDPINGKGAYLISGGYGGVVAVGDAIMEDLARVPMGDYLAAISSSTHRRTIYFPGPDNLLYSGDDVCYLEVDPRTDIDSNERRTCDAAGDPGCVVKYSFSYMDFVQPLIRVAERGGSAKLSKHVTAWEWQSQDNAPYMRVGTAVLTAIEFLADHFFHSNSNLADFTLRTAECERDPNACGAGYRSSYRNTTLRNGGNNRVSSTSHHRDGVAADIILKSKDANIIPAPTKCDVLLEAAYLIQDRGEVKAENTNISVHIAVPGKPGMDTYRWRCN